MADGTRPPGHTDVNVHVVRVQDVTIRANNVVELRAFYASIGLREVLVRDDLVVFAAGDSELVIHATADRPDEAVGFGLLVADIEPIERRLRHARVAYEGPMPLRPGKRGVRFRDPNGNVVEFLRPASE